MSSSKRVNIFNNTTM